MKVFSTFTGIGGFEIGIENAAQGKHKIELVGYSEIDKYAIQVFEKHYKGVKNYGDITKINAESLPDFDCLVGGFPCQAFSIAGRRGGFNDTRGTLFYDLARILRAKQPRLFVFENVKGLCNHDGGRTFRTIITTINELGYDCQWQVLNSKDFGVPQNRERIIIVGHLRGSARPQVFPITSSNSQAGRADAVKVGTLRTHKDGNGFREMKSGIAPTLPARARNDGSGQPVILTASPKYVDGKRTVSLKVSDTAPTIRATQHKSGDNQPKVLVREATKKGYAEATVGDSINLSQPNSKTRRGRVGKGIANTLDTGMHQYTILPKVVSFNRKEGITKELDVAHALQAGDYRWLNRNQTQNAVARPVITPDRINKSQNGRRFKDDGEPAFTVTAQDRHGIYDGATIRRLTPMECERLQAFPDNWTAEGVDGPISDTQRYKMCGNAVTTNVIQAVFERILA